MKAKYIEIGENYYNGHKIVASVTDSYINIVQYEKDSDRIQHEITLPKETFTAFAVKIGYDEI